METASQADTGSWRVIVHSLADAGAGLVGALREISPLPESRLAELLYQAPSELWKGLDRASAERLNGLLRQTGLDSRVLAEDERFEPGDAGHEVALVVREPARMTEVAARIVELLGVSPGRARQILWTSPTVLLGRISASTAADIRRRFTALAGVEVDVSQASLATFDLFLGEGPATDRARVLATLRELGCTETSRGAGPLLASDLSHDAADALWRRLGRTSLPLRILNRDFERFDVRLEQATATPELTAFLVETGGMPAEVAARVLARAPIVTHTQVPFHRLTELLEGFASRGARATGQLLAFQAFALKVLAVGDRPASLTRLGSLATLSEKEARAVLVPGGRVQGPLTAPQARWLQWELRQVGTETALELR